MGKVVDLCRQPTKFINLAMKKIEYSGTILGTAFTKSLPDQCQTSAVPDQCQIFWKKNLAQFKKPPNMSIRKGKS